MNSEGMSWKSSRVITAFTPGSASALEVSIDLILACGWGLRRTLPTSMPGKEKSAPKRARPVTLSTPSGRTGRVPIHFKAGWISSLFRAVAMSASSDVGGGIHHGAHDLVVAGAAAEIAGQPVAHLGLAGIRIAVEQGFRGDQEARRTDAALQGGMLQKFLLQRMQLLAVRHALNGLDRAALGFGRQHQAGADQAVPQHHAAGPTAARAAAFLAAGELQL